MVHLLSVEFQDPRMPAEFEAAVKELGDCYAFHRDWAGYNIADAEATWLGARNYASSDAEDEVRVRRASAPAPGR
jgi:hypothetical protein